MFRVRRLTCSFCGKSDDEVNKLVAGPHVYICDRCAVEAVRIMEQSAGGDSSPREPRTSAFSRMLRRVFSVSARNTSRVSKAEAGHYVRSV